MYGDDDRVKTLLKSLKLEDRLISFNFDDKFDYMKAVDYSKYNNNIENLKDKANAYIEKYICN